MTLYTGVRLNDSTELLVDIEEAGGPGLTNALASLEPRSGHRTQSLWLS